MTTEKLSTSSDTKITRFLPPSVVSLAFFLVYLIVFAHSPALFNDPDAAWHIIAGDMVRSTGHLPDTNTWSFVVPDQKWYLVSWLWDVTMSGIHSLGGTLAVFVVTQALVALTLALVIYHIRSRGGISNAVLIIIAVLAAISFNRFVACRPQLIGYLFLAFYHFRLHQSRTNLSWRPLLWFPVLMLIWVNMHGSFFTGFLLIGVYALEALWHRNWPWLMRLASITGVCLIVVLFNPYGFGIYHAVMGTLGSIMPQFIEEWGPFTFGRDWGVTRWLVLFLFLSNFREPTIPLADKLLSALWLVPMLSSVRHASIFILLSAPYIAINLQRFIEYVKGRHSLRFVNKFEIRIPLLQPVMALAALAAILASMGFTGKFRQDSYVLSPWFDSRPAIAWMMQHLQGKRVLNDYDFGGIVIYESHGTFPVFVDGRAGTAYPEEVLSDYERFEHFYRDWEKVPNKYRIDAILTNNQHTFAARYVEGARYQDWELAYSDPVASIFVRKPPPVAAPEATPEKEKPVKKKTAAPAESEDDSKDN